MTESQEKYRSLCIRLEELFDRYIDNGSESGVCKNCERVMPITLSDEHGNCIICGGEIEK